MIKKKQTSKKTEPKRMFSTFFNDLDSQMKGFVRELKSTKENEAETNKKVS